MNLKSCIAGGLAVLVVASAAIAQNQPLLQETRPEARNPARAAEGQAGSQNQVAAVAGMLALGNKAEIELAKLALEKSRHPQVRQFAEQMIKDHTAFLGKLKQFNPRIELTNVDADGTTTIRREPTARPGNAPNDPRSETIRERRQQRRDERGEQATEALPNDRRGEGAGQAGTMNRNSLPQIAHRAAQIKLRMTKEMLSKYEGQDFDMGYLGEQIVAHIGMMAHLQAVQNLGDEQFQQLVAQGIQTTQQHMQEAQQIARQLEDKERGGTNADTTTNPRRTTTQPAQPEPRRNP
ncbi:MAG: DUF4142 domain-containing protein [Planctomycetales bacterium]|nr:DUF4142 domain-containing protein [Planctomycetales bacterium]MCA9223758.1 DUF4142 domain-containing protein [Planctomycetales bacterium]